MKIKSIAAICKKDKHITIFDKRSRDGESVMQWLGNGGAAYPVSGLPYLEEASVFTIFDVPEKSRNDYFVRAEAAPEGICFDDTEPGEMLIDEGDLVITYAGRALKPLQTNCGIVFVENRYLAPIADVLDVVELYERRTASGTPYIVAKAGFLVQAVIMPYDIVNEKFIQQMEDLTSRCRLALAAKEAARAEAAQRDASGVREYTIADIDPETGEIIEDTEDSEDEKEV